MRSLLAFLPFSCFAFWRFMSFKRKDFQISIFVFIFALSILNLSPSGFSEEKVQYLKKAGEIKEGFSSEKENFFIKITGLCCDDEGNLYVADSGWNKIFKFDPNGKFIMSFGREGQGPGEFLAHPMRAHLKISFGNDGKLYVNDPGNGRLSVFSKEGKFIKSFKLPPYTYDTPVVNSKGDIYLLSKSGIKVIDCYDSNFKYKGSLLDIEEHLQFPFRKPVTQRSLKKPWIIHVSKLMTEKDYLLVISHFSLGVFIYDFDNNLQYKFKIDREEFFKDLKKRINRSFKEYQEFRIKVKSAEFVPIATMKGFVYKNEILGLLYGRSNNQIEILEYNLNGKFLKSSLTSMKELDWFQDICLSNFNNNLYIPFSNYLEIWRYYIQGG